jgi:hypothetical protein
MFFATGNVPTNRETKYQFHPEAYRGKRTTFGARVLQKIPLGRTGILLPTTMYLARGGWILGKVV